MGVYKRGDTWRDIRDGQIYLTGDRTKNGKDREIPVSAKLAEELGRLQQLREGSLLVLGDGPCFRPSPAADCAQERAS